MDVTVDLQTGMRTGPFRAVVKREHVRLFAACVKNEDAAYENVDAARAAGYSDLPAPPTFPILFWKEADPYWLKQAPFLFLGEQRFDYERPLIAGDTYSCELRITKTYEKEGSFGRLRFFEHELSGRSRGKPVFRSLSTLIQRVGTFAPRGVQDANRDIQGSALSFSRADIRRYADFTGDGAPIHTQDEAAKKWGFSAPLVQGMLLMGAAADIYRPSQMGMRFVKTYRMRFLQPLLAGEGLHIEKVEKRREVELQGTGMRSGLTVSGKLYFGERR